jgi:predicted protein tyrosine phosphatase
LNILFICGKNRLRSPSAEHIFADWPNVETASAGISHDADNPVSPELLKWSDIIFVMESAHQTKLSAKFKSCLANKRVVCLNIPDNYKYMEASLIDALMSKVPRYLPGR